MSAKSLELLRLACAAFALPLAGCAAENSFRGDAFHHGTYPYVVRYSAPEHKQILPPEWRLDNYYTSTFGDVVGKKGRDYQAVLAFDLDDDGRVDDQTAVPLYDLKFEHRQTAAQIWLRTLPVSTHLRDKDLAVLVELYARALSGAEYVHLSWGEGRLLVDQGERLTARVVESKPTTLGGRPAVWATIEVASADEVKIAPEARRERVRVVFARPGFVWTRSMRHGPTLLIAGYSNLPADFDRQLSDFDGFLSQISLSVDDRLLGSLRDEAIKCAQGKTPIVAALVDAEGQVGQVLDGGKALSVKELGCIQALLKKATLTRTGDPYWIELDLRPATPHPAPGSAAVPPAAPPAAPPSSAPPDTEP